MDVVKTNPLNATYSRSEARHDAIGRAARDIISQEAAKRSRNTERLKAARLARDAAEPPVIAAPAAPAKRRKKATS